MNCYIEPRGKQHRVYWRKPGGGKDYIAAPTRAEAETIATAVRENGPDAVRAFLAEVKNNPTPVGPAPAAQSADLPARPGNPTGVTFADLATSYLAGLTGREPKTTGDYAGQISNHLLPFFGDTDIGMILSKQPAGSSDPWVTVAGWVGWVQGRSSFTNQGKPSGKPLASKTIGNLHGVLYAIFATAVEDELTPLLVRNPCHKTKMPEAEHVERVFLEPRGFAALLKWIPEFWHALMITLVGTGIRWGEAAGLQVKRVTLDPQDGRPYLDVAMALGWRDGKRTLGRLKSQASRRRIWLSPAVVEVLRPLVEGRDPEALVFTTPTGAMLHHSNFTDRVLKPAIAKAAVEGLVPIGTRIHALRHTSAAWMASAGCNLQMIKKRLGHSSILTTDKIYGHLCEAADALTLAAIDSGLAGFIGGRAHLHAVSAEDDPTVAAHDPHDLLAPDMDLDDSDDLAA